MANRVKWLYVRYADNMTADCPLSFVDPEENFDPCSFDSKKFYSIFWSKEEDDTPEKMAKRVATIPRFDKSDKSGRPGYYPARILDCGESEEDLENKKKAKRISIPSEKVLYNSQVLNTGHRKGKGANKEKSKINEGKGATDSSQKDDANKKSIKSVQDDAENMMPRKRGAPTPSLVYRSADSGRSAKVARYQEYTGVPIGTDVLGSEEDDLLESSDCSDDQGVIPEKIHRIRVESLEKKCRKLENKLDQKNGEIRELRKTLDASTALNVQYQQDLIQKLMNKVKNCSCSTPSTSSLNRSSAFSINKPKLTSQITKLPATLTIPAPSTPTPTIPTPSTTAPSTPAPSTPAPSTPAPSTPAPSTPAPSTPAPSTPAPSTSATSTLAPTKLAPVATIAGGDMQNLDTLDQATDVENNSNELIEIHPNIKVHRASWDKISECVETCLANTAKFPNTESADREFVYAVAQKMWGTDVLSRSTVTGKGFKGKKDADGKPVTPSADALPTVELDTVHGALRKRIHILNGIDDPKRSSFTVLKSFVRQKVHNVKKSIK